MDETPEYIKMAQKATEIQEAWKPQSGDFIHSNLKEQIRIIYFSDHHGNPPEVFLNSDYSTWLPRQDQLQEIIGESLEDLYSHFIMEIDRTGSSGDIDGSLAEEYSQFNSMEQLWLAHLMKMKYNKFWNGEDWVVA